MALLVDDLHVQTGGELVESAGLPLFQFVGYPHFVVAAGEGGPGLHAVGIVGENHGGNGCHC